MRFGVFEGKRARDGGQAGAYRQGRGVGVLLVEELACVGAVGRAVFANFFADDAVVFKCRHCVSGWRWVCIDGCTDSDRVHACVDSE